MDRLVTATELAGILHVTKETIYRRARAGEIPSSRVGRAWRFDVDAVKAKIAQPPRPWQQSNRSLARKRAT